MTSVNMIMIPSWYIFDFTNVSVNKKIIYIAYK